ERQARRQLHVADRTYSLRGRLQRLSLDAEEEIRINEELPQRELDAEIEITTFPTIAVGLNERLQFEIGDRTSICATGQSGHDFLDARQLILARARSAYEHTLATWCLSWSDLVEWTSQSEAANAGGSEGKLIRREAIARRPRLRNARGCGPLVEKRKADDLR